MGREASDPNEIGPYFSKGVVIYILTFSFFFQATSLPEAAGNSMGDIESEQLKSVIYGLLRQNSYTFLEVLEEAR